jgi:hypothetical protein
VSVNDIVITENAGNNDDGIGSLSEGQLISVGGFDDPFPPLLPGYGDDHERYNLQPYITKGDKAIAVKTSNFSRDDNIFLAGFYVTGRAGVSSSTVPEPGALTLLALGIAVFGAKRSRKN